MKWYNNHYQKEIDMQELKKKNTVMDSPWKWSVSSDGKEILIEALQGEFYEKGESDAPSTIVCSVEGARSLEERKVIAEQMCKDHNETVTAGVGGGYL